MWYEDAIEKVDQSKIYSRRQIFDFLEESKPNYSVKSFEWVINSMVKDGLLIRVRRNAYKIASSN